MKMFPIAHFNGDRDADELVIYNGVGRTGTNSYGLEACIVGERVVRFGTNDNLIPEGGYVVSGHGKAADFIAQNLCMGARAVIDTEKNEFYAEIDGEALRLKAESLINTIKERLQARIDEGASFDKAKAEQILSAAIKAKDAENYDEVNTLCEEAYYYTAQSVKGEIRAIWHRPHEKSDEEVEATVSKLADAGFNRILIETNYEGYANAQKCVHDYLPIRKGYENGFDVVEAFIRICKKRSIEIHAWFEDFFFGVEGTGCPMAEIHPELMARRKDGGLLHDTFDNFYFLNPALDETHEFLRNMIREILDNYDFDGFQLDYIRYPVIHGIEYSAGFEPKTKEMFKADTGIDVDSIDSLGSDEWKRFIDWRAGRITKYVESVRNLILEYRKNGRSIELSTAVFGNPDEAIRLKCQNWQYWVKQGWLDAIYPMAYLNDAEDVGREVGYMVEHYGESPNISGISPMYDKLPVIESTKQVEECRKVGAKGVAFFCADSCTDIQLEKLKIGVFRDR